MYTVVNQALPSLHGQSFKIRFAVHYIFTMLKHSNFLRHSFLAQMSTPPHPPQDYTQAEILKKILNERYYLLPSYPPFKSLTFNKIHCLLTHVCLHKIDCLCYCCYAQTCSLAVKKCHKNVHCFFLYLLTINCQTQQFYIC